MPVPTVGFRDRARAARAIACGARSNTRFRAKVTEGMVGEQQNSDRRSFCSRHRYLQLGFATLRAQCPQLRAKRAQTLVLDQKWQKDWWESDEIQTEGLSLQDAGTYSWVSCPIVRAQGALKHSF